MSDDMTTPRPEAPSRAWAWIPSAAWGQWEVSLDPARGALARELGLPLVELVGAEVERLTVKCRGTLANNLCSDHRDKQVGKPCLACTIETLERRLTAAQGEPVARSPSSGFPKDGQELQRMLNGAYNKGRQDAHAARDLADELRDAAPTPPKAEDEFETRADGARVRKDRWEVGIRRIVALLWGNKREFEVDEVIDAVRALVPQPVNEGDDERLVRAVLEPTPPKAEAQAVPEGLRRLAAFGAWAVGEFRCEIGDVDGASAQDAMERLGVLHPVTVAEPCGEPCRCADYGEFPIDCFRLDPLVRSAMDALAAAPQAREGEQPCK